MWYFVRGFFSLSITCLRLTYVVACNIIPFSCLIIFYCMTIAHSIYSLTDGHLDCIYILAIRNNAVMNICVPIFVWMYVFIFFWVWNFLVILCLTFWETAKTATLFYNPIRNVWGFYFFHMLVNRICLSFIGYLFDFSQPSGVSL